jgi:hypothetical protein
MRFHECSMFLVVSGLKFETPPAVKCEAFPAEKIRRVHSQNRRAFEVVLSTYVDGLPGGFLLFSGRNPNQTMAPWGSWTQAGALNTWDAAMCDAAIHDSWCWDSHSNQSIHVCIYIYVILYIYTYSFHYIYSIICIWLIWLIYYYISIYIHIHDTYTYMCIYTYIYIYVYCT